MRSICNLDGLGKALFRQTLLVLTGIGKSKLGIYHDQGLDRQGVLAHKWANGSIVGYPSADRITNQELLSLEVDILVPAALEEVLTEANANRVRARVTVEGANAPTTHRRRMRS